MQNPHKYKRGTQIFDLIIKGYIGAHQVGKVGKSILDTRNNKAKEEQGILGRITNNWAMEKLLLLLNLVTILSLLWSVPWQPTTLLGSSFCLYSHRAYASIQFNICLFNSACIELEIVLSARDAEIISMTPTLQVMEKREKQSQL